VAIEIMWRAASANRAGRASPASLATGLSSLRLVAFVALVAAAVVLFGAIVGDARAGRQDRHPRVVLVASGCNSNDFICHSFVAALRKTRVSGQVISLDPREDRVGTLSLLAQQGYDLVIVDFASVDALEIVAARFPKTRFALFDAPLDVLRGHPRNVAAIVHLPNEAAYLAGWLAARLEQSRTGKDVVGVVGGLRITSVMDFVLGFRAGARAADPGITVLEGYSRDFSDANKCEAIARSQIARGAGTVFDVAGTCGLGALHAAKVAGVWGIGVDTDQSSLGPHILTSVVKGYRAGFETLLEQVRNGRIQTGRTTVLTLRNNGAYLGRISSKVPAALIAELARVRRRILTGAIHVPSAEAR
jgi:basic membrane protein A and related proteins